MALSVIQTLSVQQVYTGSFGSNVTAGNSVVFVLTAFTTSSATITSSAPTFNGSAVTGGTLLVQAQSTTSGTNQVYAAIWLLPNLTGGATGPVALTVTNGGTATAIGFTAWEVAGLGVAPSVDQTVSANAATGTTLSSGTTPAITAAPEFIAAAAVSFGNAITGVGAPWTEINSAGGTDSIEAFQIVTGSGGTFSYAPTAAGSAGWASMIATIKGTGVQAAPTRQMKNMPFVDVFNAGWQGAGHSR